MMSVITRYGMPDSLPSYVAIACTDGRKSGQSKSGAAYAASNFVWSCMCGVIQPAMFGFHWMMSMLVDPALSSPFSRAVSASPGRKEKSTLMPVCFSNAGATSCCKQACHGPLSPI